MPDLAAVAGDGAGRPSDTDLIWRAKRGDRCALELIMRRHNRRLYRVALAVMRNPWDAEDVLQDSYVRAFTRLHEFAGPDGLLGAWLAKITLNEARQRLRRRRGEAAFVAAPPPVALGEQEDMADDPLTSSPSADPGPEHLAAAGEIRRLLEAAIGALPTPFRTVFILRAVERMSIAETAECLAIPPATVKTRLHRANALLRRRLQAHADSLMPELFPFAGARCDRVVAAVLARLTSIGGAGRETHKLPS